MQQTVSAVIKTRWWTHMGHVMRRSSQRARYQNEIRNVWGKRKKKKKPTSRDPPEKPQW